MVVMAIILLLFVLMVGVLYFRLHALPERFAHKKVQFEIVCVLALLAMFTHMHIFWTAGLLLAMVDFPDFSGLLKSCLSLLRVVATFPARVLFAVERRRAARERRMGIVENNHEGASVTR
jgi:hypothetical protein